MAEQSAKFRSALHGYNRDDVVNFLDKLSKSHAAEKQSLQAASEQLRARLEETEQALEQANARAEQTEASKQQLEQLQAEGEKLREELSRLLEENGRLEAENTELQEAKISLQNKLGALEEALEQARAAEPAPEEDFAQAEETEPPLSAPLPPVEEAVPEAAPARDYTEMELAAYRRAEMAERLARERASEVYRQVQSVFGQADARLETGKADLDEMMKALQADVNQLMLLVSNIRSTYSDAELSFGQIAEKNHALEADEAE